MDQKGLGNSILNMEQKGLGSYKLNMDQKGLGKISNADKKWLGNSKLNSDQKGLGWGRGRGLVIPLNFECEFESGYNQTPQIRTDFKPIPLSHQFCCKSNWL